MPPSPFFVLYKKKSVKSKVVLIEDKISSFVLFLSFFQLGTVSLALFHTLIGLYCEDVMLQLILRWVTHTRLSLLQSLVYVIGLGPDELLLSTSYLADLLPAVFPPSLLQASVGSFWQDLLSSAPTGTWSPVITSCWVRDVWWGSGTATRCQPPKFWH